MKLKFDISHQDFLIAQAILEKNLPNNCQVWVFGSRAKNKAFDYSDLDLALECENKVTLNILNQLKTDFEKSKLPYRVDVLDLNAVEPYFQNIINKKKILFPFKAEGKVPQLRFAEFSRNWTINAIGNLAKIDTGNRDTQDRVNSGKYPFYVRSNTIERIDEYAFNGEAILTSGDGVGVGKNFHYIVGKFNYHQRVYSIHNFTNSTNGKFIYYYFADKFYRRVSRLSAKNSVDSVRMSMIADMPISIPTKPEQQKIANFLTAVDNKIEQLSKKQALLGLWKKGLMQKIFSQAIRFKADDGSQFPNWEENNVGSFMIERNIKSIKSDEYPLMSFVAHNGITKKGDRYNRGFLVNDENNKKYKQTKYSDFIYSSNNLETGSIGLNKYGSATISPVYSVFKITKSCDYQFISSLLTTKSFIYKMIRFRQGVVYGQLKIHESAFLKIKVNLPHLQEQTKIANFLSLVDTKIEQVAKQLDESKQFKKALLQQMFV